ncbi:hypothetical protein LTR56_005308 [Elasticomyces elasticus]|nr:hypothetical protein LTR56_005308 [Elasticomyces elasticus]KAK3663200.1 hypothetical protein LTR22_005858 [Elasticomyces elasticus]KAK4929142.1 hypothetical protein LTR49_004339 [Elasticomyces elasticus]KAK5766522.1 hypothetical protein LTS12_003439 [Elasticomyces elasticus]
MLERAAIRVWRGDSLLPFLYCTRTIQQRSYTQVSRGVTSSRPQYERRKLDGVTRRPGHGSSPWQARPQEEGYVRRGDRFGRGNEKADSYEPQQYAVRRPGYGASLRQVKPQDERADGGGDRGPRVHDAFSQHARRDNTERTGGSFGRRDRQSESASVGRLRFGGLGGGVRRRDIKEFRPQDRSESTSEPIREDRTFSSRAPGTPTSEGVPFEDTAQELIAGRDPADSTSTITPREKKVFEKLLGLRKDKTSATTTQTKDSSSGAGTGLDAILDSAITNIKQHERPPPQFPDALRPLAEEAREKQRAQRAARAEETTAESATIQADLSRTNKLLDAAPTDILLWEILNKHVLNRAAYLRLDAVPTSTASIKTKEALRKFNKIRNKPSAKTKESELDILTSNFPLWLMRYLEICRREFPTSILPLNLLPILHALGPSILALGASTQLYNAHLRLLITHYPHHVPDFAKVLAEMDRLVYAFDEETLEIVDDVIKGVNRYQHGHAGPGPQALFKMEGMQVQGLNVLIRWRRIMGKRREEAAVRGVREGWRDEHVGVEGVVGEGGGEGGYFGEGEGVVGMRV